MFEITVGNREVRITTGTHADYTRAKSVLREINRRETLSLKLIVTGSHLMNMFDNSTEEIEKDGFDIASRVPMFTDDYYFIVKSYKDTNG